MAAALVFAGHRPVDNSALSAARRPKPAERMNPDGDHLRLTLIGRALAGGGSLTVRALVWQLVVRLAMVGGVLTVAGVTTYSATHWEPNMNHHSAPSTVVAR